MSLVTRGMQKVLPALERNLPHLRTIRVSMRFSSCSIRAWVRLSTKLLGLLRWSGLGRSKVLWMWWERTGATAMCSGTGRMRMIGNVSRLRLGIKSRAIASRTILKGNGVGSDRGVFLPFSPTVFGFWTWICRLNFGSDTHLVFALPLYPFFLIKTRITAVDHAGKY